MHSLLAFLNLAILVSLAEAAPLPHPGGVTAVRVYADGKLVIADPSFVL